MSTEKKLTAVEWLHEEMLKGKISMKDILEQAKEKEKQNIIDVCVEFGMNNETTNKERGEQYYRETFKN
jgi:2-iminoacetate synthase ThiH